MKTLRARLGMVLLLLACLAGSGQAQAQTCNVSSLPVSFGTYDPKASLPTDITGSVSVTCQATISLLVAYTIKLSAGTSGNMLARKMAGSGFQLAYQIYRDPTFTQVWGDGSSGTYINNGGYLLAILVPVTINYIAYGRITALQNAYAGSYVDTLTILVTY